MWFLLVSDLDVRTNPASPDGGRWAILPRARGGGKRPARQTPKIPPSFATGGLK